MRPLPRSRLTQASWLVPAFAAALWFGVMTTVADAPIATQRSMVFLGGPLLLLSGMHARLFGFLHAPERLRWLPLPIVAERHWQAAIRMQLPGFGIAVLLGILALILALGSEPMPNGITLDLGLAAEFVWLAVVAALLEPSAAATAAFLGRRFPEHGRGHELQRSLGGGWTTPEAVVHLYAPAFFLALATALAMPGQLSLERWLDGHPPSAGSWAAALLPLLVAIGLRALAPRHYRVGMWEAVAWLSEATRTLAGPPQPEATPAWAGKISDPWIRMLVIQFWRITPLPYLRLALVLGVAVVAWVRADPPTGPLIAVAMACVGAWLIPAGAVLRESSNRARMSGALPLSPGRRQGRPGAVALITVAAPPVLMVGVLAIRILTS
jgi:hypothetical protein